MKRLLALLCLMLPGLALAASPEAAYVAARNAAVERLGAYRQDSAHQAAFEKDYARSKEDLTRRLRLLIGPVKVTGFAGPGEASFGDLLKGDEGFGSLDGLVFRRADGKGTLTIATKSLFQRWLIEHRQWWGTGLAEMPQKIEEALSFDDFYTQAIETGAAYRQIASLSLARPSRADHVVAALGARTQSIDPEAPDELIVAVIAGARVLIVETKLQEPVPAIPECSGILRASESEAQDLNEAYEKSGRKDAGLMDKLAKAQRDGVAAFTDCFTQKGANTPGVKNAEAQAAALAEAMAAP